MECGISSTTQSKQALSTRALSSGEICQGPLSLFSILSSLRVCLKLNPRHRGIAQRVNQSQQLWYHTSICSEDLDYSSQRNTVQERLDK